MLLKVSRVGTAHQRRHSQGKITDKKKKQMTSRLDQIEEILAQTAQIQQAHAEAIARIDARLDRFAEETERRIAALDRFAEETERRIAAGERAIDNLSRNVDNTARTVDAMGLSMQNLIRNTDVAQARISQIWEYLMRQSPNGGSATS